MELLLDFQRELLARLPLADAVLSLFGFLFNDTFLDQVFDRHRGRCYERDLSFARLVELLRDALLVHQGSGRASFEQAAEQGDLPVLVGSVYQKLSRVPVEVSMAMLRESACQLPQVLPTRMACPLPPSLHDLQVVVLDGKVLKHVPHLLKPLRPLQGKLLGGRVLVALAMHPGLALAMNATPDAFRNDVPLVDQTVQQVREKLTGSILWITDRQMCDLKLMELFTQNKDHFLIRYNRSLSFEPDSSCPAQHGTDCRGRKWVQQWGWAGAKTQKNRRYLRRITLEGEPGQEQVILISDLLDEKQYPANDLLEAYLQRWGIERMFQKVTEVFHLKQLIGTAPQAIVFQASLCFLLYNLIQVVRCYVAQAGECPVEAVSTQKLFEDVTKELTSWSTLGDIGELLRYRRRLKLNGPAAMRAHLRDRLGGLWRDRWIKSPSRPRAGGQRRTIRVKSGRSSVWKVLQAHKEQLAKPKQTPKRC